MRKFSILLAVAIVAAQSVGCGCCQRFRDWLCRGAYCAAPAPTYAVPAPCAVPPPVAGPMVAPMAAPMATTCPQCYPMETSFDPGCAYDPSCAYGAGMPMYGSGGWTTSGGGGVMTTDPGPAPVQQP